MISKKDRFAQWRKGKTDAEQSYLDAALFLEEFLSRAESFADITRDAERTYRQSLLKNPIKKHSHYRAGVFVHTILSIAEAIDLLPAQAQERSLLAEVNTHLSVLYDDYLNDPGARIKAIINKLDLFLQKNELPFTENSKALQLYDALYLFLLTLHQTLDRLPSPVHWVAVWYRINLVEIKQRVSSFMNSIEEHRMAFQRVEQVKETNTEEDTVPATGSEPLLLEDKEASPPIVNPLDEFVGVKPVSLTSLSKTHEAMQNALGLRFEAIIDDIASPSDKLTRLIAESANLVNGLNTIAATKTEEVLIREQINKLMQIRNIFTLNDQRIIGRKYFSELYAECGRCVPGGFDLLLRLSTGEPANQLLERVNHRDERSIESSSLYWLSTISSPLTVLVRLVIHHELLSVINQALPETSDAHAKRLTLDIIDAVYRHLYVARINPLCEERFQIIETLCALDDDDDDSLDALYDFMNQEPADGLIALASLYEIKQPAEELLPHLVVAKDEPTSVKDAIQSIYQEQYYSLMLDTRNEQENMAAAFTAMREVSAKLAGLLTLRTRYEELLAKARGCIGLLNLFTHHSENRVISSIISKKIPIMHAELASLQNDLDKLAGLLAEDNALLKHQLVQASAEELEQLVSLNNAPIDVELPVEPLEAPVGESKPCELDLDDLQHHINERYLTVINDETMTDAERFDSLSKLLSSGDEHIKRLIYARNKYDESGLRSAEASNMLAALEAAVASEPVLTLSRARINYLKQEQAKALAVMRHAAEQLSPKNEVFKEGLINAPLADLYSLSEVSQSLNGCVDEYKKLTNTIKLLNRIKEGDSQLRNYVAEHYTWWVRFTDFFAQFCSIFKTDASRMIDKAKALQTELNSYRIPCEQEVALHIASLQTHEDFGHVFLDDIPQLYAYPLEAAVLANPLDEAKAIEALSKVSLFASGANQLKQQATTEPNELSCDDENEADPYSPADP